MAVKVINTKPIMPNRKWMVVCQNLSGAASGGVGRSDDKSFDDKPSDDKPLDDKRGWLDSLNCLPKGRASSKSTCPIQSIAPKPKRDVSQRSMLSPPQLVGEERQEHTL